MELSTRIKVRVELDSAETSELLAKILKKAYERLINIDEYRSLYQKGFERLTDPGEKAKLIVSMIEVTGDIDWGKQVIESELQKLTFDDEICHFSTRIAKLERKYLLVIIYHLFIPDYMGLNIKSFFYHMIRNNSAREVFRSFINTRFINENNNRLLLNLLRISADILKDMELSEKIIEKCYQYASTPFEVTNIAFEDLVILGNEQRARKYVRKIYTDSNTETLQKYLLLSSARPDTSFHLDKLLYLSPKEELLFFICSDFFKEVECRGENLTNMNEGAFISKFIASIKKVYSFDELRELFLDKYLLSFHGWPGWILSVFAIREDPSPSVSGELLPYEMNRFLDIQKLAGGPNPDLIKANLGKEFSISMKRADEDITPLVGFEFFIQVVMNLHLQYEDKKSGTLVVKIKEEESLEVLSILLTNHPVAFACSMIGSADLTHLRRLNISTHQNSEIYNYLGRERIKCPD